MYILAQQNGTLCTFKQTQVQNSDHRWQDFQLIKTLITDKLNNLSIIILAKSDLKTILNIFPKLSKKIYKKKECFKTDS